MASQQPQEQGNDDQVPSSSSSSSSQAAPAPSSSTSTLAAEKPPPIKFDRPRHVQYFASCLLSLPAGAGYGKLDANRMTMVHFCVHALDLLQVWEDEELQQELKLDKQLVIEWIYGCQVVIPKSSQQDKDEERYNKGHAGFVGGSFLGHSFTDKSNSAEQPCWSFLHGHVAMTYCALVHVDVLGRRPEPRRQGGHCRRLAVVARSNNGRLFLRRCRRQRTRLEIFVLRLLRFLYSAGLERRRPRLGGRLRPVLSFLRRRLGLAARTRGTRRQHVCRRGQPWRSWDDWTTSWTTRRTAVAGATG